MATLYKTDGTQEVIKPANGRKFDIKELQKLVGGLVERIKLPFEQSLVVDQEAPRKGKPVNKNASQALHAMLGGNTVPIAGDAVVGTKAEIGLG